MEITRIPAGTLTAGQIEDTLAEVVAYDLLVNAASGLGEDFDPLPTEVRKKLVRADEFTTNEIWLGRLGGELVAKGVAYLSLQDNTDVAEIWLSVHPAHRRKGLGSQLLAVIESDLVADGRMTLTSYCELPAAQMSAGRTAARVAAASGVGSLPADRAEVAFAVRHGYSLRQIERCSVATIRRDDGDDVAGTQAAAIPDDGYTVLTWSGPTPEEHRDAIALLHRAMSTDTPGAADLGSEEKWDASRVRALDAKRVTAGERMTTALAVHGDEVAGFTEAAHFDDRPHIGWQGATIVVSAHRGHGLGVCLKTANHRALADSTEVERVYTWNAVENSQMLAINDSAGFEDFAWLGVWKKLATGTCGT